MALIPTLNKISNTLMEIKIKEGTRTIYKGKINLNNKKQIAKTFNFIKMKYGYDVLKMVKDNTEEDWFY